MKDLAVCCAAGQLHNQRIVDLNHFEETSDCVQVVLTLQPSLGVIVAMETLQRQSESDFEVLLHAAMEGCTEVYNQMQLALRVRLKQLALAAGKIES